MDKLCKDCRYSTPRHNGSGLTFCLNPNNLSHSKIDGAQEMERSCAGLREHGKCGPEAVWFVKR
jgi:hypothetical protein